MRSNPEPESVSGKLEKRELVSPIRLLLAVILLIWPPLLTAQSLSNADQQALMDDLRILEDPKGNLTLATAISHQGWEDHKGGTFNAGFSQSTWWLRVPVRNPGNVSQERLLSISYPLLGDITIHQIADDGSIESVRMGFNYPFFDRPIDHRMFILPMRWEPGEQKELVIRVESSSSLQVPLTLWKSDAFYSATAYDNLAHGIFFGTLLAIAAYNLLLFLSLRDLNYLIYVASVIFILLLIASINGFTYRFLWPEATRWNSQAVEVFIALAVGFSALFTRQFLELPKYSTFLTRLVGAIIGIAAVSVPLSFLVPYHLSISFLIPFTVLSCSAALIAGVVTWRKGQVTARYYLVAWSLLLVGLVVLALSKAGLLPATPLTNAAGQIGSMFEVILLSFALAQRISSERKLRFAAQQQLLEESHRHNRELEGRVRERTQMLETLNQRLNELSMTDSLTGLKNRRYFDETLENELQRAQRKNRPLSLALLDIDLFKPLNDTHGHQAGDECLKHLGDILQASIRSPSDTPARYGGEEFALILPEADAETACQILERIRLMIADTKVPYDDLELTFTVSIGFTTTGSGDRASADNLVKEADQALYQAKESGRNRTIQFELPSVSPHPTSTG